MKQTIKSATQEQLNSVLTLLRVTLVLLQFVWNNQTIKFCWGLRAFQKIEIQMDCKYAEYEYVTMYL
jgi:hypothetical protein